VSLKSTINTCTYVDRLKRHAVVYWVTHTHTQLKLVSILDHFFPRREIISSAVKAMDFYPAKPSSI